MKELYKFRVRTRNGTIEASETTHYYSLKPSKLKDPMQKGPSRTLKLIISGTFLSLLTIFIAQAQQGQPEPISEVKVGKNRELLVNGKPFLPIMSWAQPAKNYGQLKDLGFNTHTSGSADIEAAKGVGCYAVPGFREGKPENDFILGWIFDDEPDLPKGRGAEAKPRQTADEVAKKSRMIKGANPNRLLFITLTGHFLKEQSTYPDDLRAKMYPEYIKSADVVGFDIYPIYGWGWASHLDWPGRGVTKLRELSGDRPVYAWIETSKGSKWMPYEKQPDVLPIHTRNEVWQAIIRGATAIGYFTHAWFPEFNEFAATPEMQQELGRLNSQLARLAPAILSPRTGRKIEMKLGEGLNCHFKATESDGYLHLFAQNIDLGPDAEKGKQYEPIFPRNGKAIISVKGLKAGTTIEVVDENRTITADKGTFTDEFAALAEHIYRIEL